MEEAEQPGDATENVARLGLLVRRRLKLARAEAPGVMTGSTLLEGGGGRPLRVARPAEVWSAVLGILRDKVVQHVGPGASCSVNLDYRGWLAMTWVADDGYRISPGITGRVFVHFLIKVRERGGTGLERSTARSQAEAAGGTLPLLPSERGRLFEIRLSLSMPPRPPA